MRANQAEKATSQLIPAQVFDDELMSATLERNHRRALMGDQEAHRLSSLLKDIRDNQKLQLDRQAEALAL